MAAKRPTKPYKTFPLWPHKSGSWCAVIDGNRESFGGWRTDPKGSIALGNYNRFMEARRLGEEPAADAADVPVSRVVNLYVTRQHLRATAGEIGFREYRDTLASLKEFGEFVGAATKVAVLRPPTFAAYRTHLMGLGLSPSTIKRYISHVKTMFKWAYDQMHVAAPPRFGDDFKAPRKSAKRKLLFTPEEVAGMLATAGLPLRAMIRLGIECGFGQTDVAALRWSEIDTAKRVIDLPAGRVKTEAPRRCFVSPAVVADLKEWQAIQGKRELPRKDASLAFTTKRGEQFVREVPREDPLRPPLVVDSVALAFGKLMRDKLKIPPDGRGFYTLRRTHRTWTDELRDPHAAALAMGHSFQSIAGLYVQDIGDERLSAINAHVLKKLKEGEQARRRRARGGGGDSSPAASAGASAPAPRTSRNHAGQFATASRRRRTRSAPAAVAGQ